MEDKDFSMEDKNFWTDFLKCGIWSILTFLVLLMLVADIFVFVSYMATK